ncbi:MAG: hypothetical protein ACYDEK_09815 [Vulcanimicrobiaceae bacterium]
MIEVARTDCPAGTAVETWTGSGWIVSAEPIGVPFLATDVRNGPAWCYVGHGKINRRSRRYYLARVADGAQTGYVFEIERRLTQPDDGDAHATERFRGLAFTLGNVVALEEVVASILLLVKQGKGVLTKIDVSGIDKGALYMHCLDTGKTLNATVRRVLRRLGWDLKKRGSTTAADAASDRSDEK